MSSRITNNYDLNAEIYAKLPLEGAGTTGYLAFRDVLKLLCKYIKMPELLSLNTLDYGCGVGRSSRFLKTCLGFKQVLGVDVSAKMIEIARQIDPHGDYQLIESAQIPLAENTMDFVFSSFVVVEVATQEEIAAIFREIQRVLKVGGIFMLITTSENFFNPEYHWLSYKFHHPKQHNLKSGSLAQFEVVSYNLTLKDYYWTKEDIMNIAQSAALTLVESHQPLGCSQDGISWKSETLASPYTLFIFKK